MPTLNSWAIIHMVINFTNTQMYAFVCFRQLAGLEKEAITAGVILPPSTDVEVN